MSYPVPEGISSLPILGGSTGNNVPQALDMVSFKKRSFEGDDFTTFLLHFNAGLNALNSLNSEAGQQMTRLQQRAEMVHRLGDLGKDTKFVDMFMNCTVANDDPMQIDEHDPAENGSPVDDYDPTEDDFSVELSVSEWVESLKQLDYSYQPPSIPHMRSRPLSVDDYDNQMALFETASTDSDFDAFAYFAEDQNEYAAQFFFDPMGGTITEVGEIDNDGANDTTCIEYTDYEEVLETRSKRLAE